MKIFSAAILSSVMLVGLCIGQNSTPNVSGTPQQNSNSAQAAQPSPAQGSRSMRIAPGSVIPVQLTKTIDAKKVKPGEEVDAAVTEDLKANNGEVIVPKNTKIVGKITEAQARNKEQKESQLAIAFDHAVTNDGKNVSLPMSIQAIIATSYLSGGNSRGNNGGNAAAPSQAPSSSSGSGGMSPSSRSSGMGAPQTENPGASASEEPATNTTNSSAHQPITGKTEGVLGIEHLNLATGSAATQGSVLSSDKNNVKLEGGTMLLLRVNQ
jgi:hypothetical protein